MDNDHNSRLFPFFTGIVIGAVIGAGVALTFAPASGKRTRKQIRKTAGNIKDAAEDRWEEAAVTVREGANRVRRRFF